MPRRLLFISSMVMLVSLVSAHAELVRTEPFDYDPSGPMIFHDAYVEGSAYNHCVECFWIIAEGTIEPDTPEKFKEFVAKQERTRGRFIHFNSPGGDLFAALKLGDIIRSQGFRTVVGKTTGEMHYYDAGDPAILMNGEIEGGDRPGTCISECVFAFLGGGDRTAKLNEIGFRQFPKPSLLLNSSGKPFAGSNITSADALTAFLISYVTQKQAAPELISLAINAPSASLKFLSAGKLEKLHVARHPGRLMEWRLEPSGRGAIASAESEDKTAKLTLYCRADGSRHGTMTINLDEYFDEFPSTAEILKVRLWPVVMLNPGISLQPQNHTYSVRFSIPTKVKITTSSFRRLLSPEIEIKAIFDDHISSLDRYEIPEKQLDAVTRIAFRNCL